MLSLNWHTLRDWVLRLGEKYDVNPVIFGAIYIGAIPLFTASIAWLIRNYRKGKSILMPGFCAGLCFISAYLYLMIVGRNVPLWVYGVLAALIVLGAISAIKKIRRQIKNSDKEG